MKYGCLKKYIAYFCHVASHKYFYGEFQAGKASNRPKNGMHYKSYFLPLLSQKEKQREKKEKVPALIL